MTAIINAILPVFLLILFGWWLRNRGIPGDGFWAPAERLTYYLLFPCLIAATLADAEFSKLAVAPMAAAIALAIVAMTLLVLVFRRWFAVDGPAFSSVYQGAVRMNTYIGLSVAVGVHSTSGLEAAALAVAVIVPLVNVTCVLMLAYYAGQSAPSVANVAKQFVMNPLIIACAIGGLLNITNLGVPPLIGPMAEILARAALPLGLLAVGAALDFAAAKHAGAVVLKTSVLKLAVLPLFTWLLLWAFDVEGVAAFVALLFNALPTAPTAYILARQMGGDATLMASMISVQTLLSVVSLPLWLGGLG